MTRHLLVAHGSPDPRHAAVLRSVATAVTAYGVPAEVAFLEHDEPRAADRLAAHRPGDGTLAVAGLLLAPGYHASEDVPRLVGVAPGDVLDLGTLGAGPWLFPVLDELVAAAGGRSEGEVVLATAGSTRRSARTLLEAFGRAWGATGGTTTVVASADELAGLAPGDQIVVPLLLAPGVLADRVAEAAGDLGLRCTSVLGLAGCFAAALAGRLVAGRATGSTATLPVHSR